MSWWETTKNNAGSICSETFRNISGVSFSTALPGSYVSVKNSIGWETEMSVVIGAGTWVEKGTAAAWLGTAWCAGAYVGGGVDAWWQVNHDGKHLGMSVGDTAKEWWEDTTEWYDHKADGVGWFVQGVYEWWNE